MSVTLPAGNGHLARCHAAFEAGPPATRVELRWRLPPDDRTHSTMQIWLPEGDIPAPAPALRVAVAAPDGTTTPYVAEDVAFNEREITVGGRLVGHLRYVPPTPSETRGRFEVDLFPTARADDLGAVAPIGLWRVRVQNLQYEPHRWLRAWVQRDDNLYGYPRRGRQSYLDHPCYRRFDPVGREVLTDDRQPADCPVRRAGMMNAIATGPSPLVAGGYVRKSGRPGAYAAGSIGPPVRDPDRSPDAGCVSDDSRVHAGVIHAGSRSGSRVALNGTSVAAPKLARWAAARLAAGDAADRAALAAEAAVQEATHRADDPELQGRRLGDGRIRVPPVDAPEGRQRRYEKADP